MTAPRLHRGCRVGDDVEQSKEAINSGTTQENITQYRKVLQMFLMRVRSGFDQGHSF